MKLMVTLISSTLALTVASLAVADEAPAPKGLGDPGVLDSLKIEPENRKTA